MPIDSGNRQQNRRGALLPSQAAQRTSRPFSVRLSTTRTKRTFVLIFPRCAVDSLVRGPKGKLCSNDGITGLVPLLCEAIR